MACPPDQVLVKRLIIFLAPNAYFEGVAAGVSKAWRSHSVECRSDCPLVTLALAMDASGSVWRARWVKRVKPGSAAQMGVYCLRMTLVEEGNDTLWRSHITVTDLALPPHLSVDIGCGHVRDGGWPPGRQRQLLGHHRLHSNHVDGLRQRRHPHQVDTDQQHPFFSTPDPATPLQ